MQYICSAVCSPKLDIQTDIGADFSMMLLFHTVFEFILSHVPRKSLLIPLAFTLRPGPYAQPKTGLKREVSAFFLPIFERRLGRV